MSVFREQKHHPEVAAYRASMARNLKDSRRDTFINGPRRDCNQFYFLPSTRAVRDQVAQDLIDGIDSLLASIAKN